MKVIGITGGVGSGKSRILAYIEEHYEAVICQADHVAFLLQQPGHACYEEIIRIFGTEILLPDQQLDRKKLSSIVFQDALKLKQLNHIVHPSVKEYIINQIEQERLKGTPYFFLEAAILIESHYDLLCDELWYIYTAEPIRRARLKISRGYSEHKINQIFSAQLTESAFREKCDRTIDNSSGFEQTCEQLKQAIGELS